MRGEDERKTPYNDFIRVALGRNRHFSGDAAPPDQAYPRVRSSLREAVIAIGLAFSAGYE